MLPHKGNPRGVVYHDSDREDARWSRQRILSINVDPIAGTAGACGSSDLHLPLNIVRCN